MVTYIKSTLLDSDFSAKGQILIATGNGTFAPLTVGTNNYVLTADSSEATGVKWAASASGSGTVTTVSAGNGLDFTDITSTGSVTLGTPGSLSGTSSNAVTSTSHTHLINTGIAQNDLVKVDSSTAANNDYAKFTLGGIEGRSYAEVRTDLNIEDGADVTDEANVVAALDGATLTDVGTPASTDLILLQDASDSNNLKVAQFSTFGGGSGGGAAATFERTFSGNVSTGQLIPIPIPDELAGLDIKEVRLALTALPAGQALKVDVRKSGTATTDSIFNSDVGIEVGPAESATNGLYMTGCSTAGSTVGTAGTTIDSARNTLAADDVLYIYVTQVGSTTAGSNLVVTISVA